MAMAVVAMKVKAVAMSNVQQPMGIAIAMATAIP